MIKKYPQCPGRSWSCAAITALMVVLCFKPAPAADLSFAAALSRTRADNPALAIAREETIGRREARKAARSLYFPKVGLEASYTFLNEPITIDLNSLRQVITGLHPAVAGLLPSFELPVQDDQYQKMAATVTWPVFTGGRIQAANQGAAAGIEAAEAAEGAGLEKLTAELVTRYFGLRLAQDVVAVRRQVLAAMDEHLDHATKLQARGLVAKAEQLHAAVARAEAYRQLLAAQHEAAIAMTGLQNTLNTDDPVAPSDTLFMVRPLDDVSRFQDLSRENNPKLKQLDAQQAAARQGVRNEKGTLWPEIFLFARKELITQDLTVLEPEWAAGIGARMTLFDGGARGHRIHQAEALARQVGSLTAKVSRDLSTLVDQRHHETAKAAEQFEALDSALELAKENLRVRRRAFEEGLATSLEVTDAELSLAEIRTERLAVLYQFDVSLAGLLAAVGRSDDFETYRQKGIKYNSLPGMATDFQIEKDLAVTGEAKNEN